MISIRRSEERGPADHGWLQSRHTFSFANYYDPVHMGVSALRVINDDVVAPGRGFPPHSHQDMEIISFVKKGQIQHKDSEGNTRVLPAGEFQLMSAGTGITHSEYNPSLEESLEFLQIWIVPDQYGIEPAYQQKQFSREPGLNLVVSPDGRQQSFVIQQDAFLYHLILSPGQNLKYEPGVNRVVYLHLITGNMKINESDLYAGDGVTLTDEVEICFTAMTEAVEALLFDLPVNFRD